MADRRKRELVSAALRSVLVINSFLHWTQLLYIYGDVVVVLHVSAARRSVLVANSLLQLQSFIGHNCCIWYVVVVLLVSAALRSVLVTNSLLQLQTFIGHNCCIWYVVVVLLVSAALRSPCDQLPFTTIVHWTQLLYRTAVYMVRSRSSARECCST